MSWFLLVVCCFVLPAFGWLWLALLALGGFRVWTRLSLGSLRCLRRSVLGIALSCASRPCPPVRQFGPSCLDTDLLAPLTGDRTRVSGGREVFWVVCLLSVWQIGEGCVLGMVFSRRGFVARWVRF